MDVSSGQSQPARLMVHGNKGHSSNDKKKPRRHPNISCCGAGSVFQDGHSMTLTVSKSHGQTLIWLTQSHRDTWFFDRSWQHCELRSFQDQRYFSFELHSIPAASMAGLQALANVAATARVAYEMIQNSATGCVLRFGSFDQAQRVLGFALQPILAGHNASRSGLDSASIRNEPSTVESMSTWFDLESFSPVQSSHCHSVSFESLHECWAQGKMWWEWERIGRKTNSWCFDWSFPTSHPQLLMISKSDHMFLGYILSYCYYVEVAVEGAKFTCD